MFRSSFAGYRFWVLVVAAMAPVVPVTAQEGEIRWRTDYNEARKEAQEKGIPLFVDIGTEDCFYCRKLDATTLRDPAISAMLSRQFVPLRIDGNRDTALVKALNVQVYPTLVLAGPDGKIHKLLSGYQTVDQLREPLRLTITAATASLVVKAATAGDAIVGDKTNLTRAREILALAHDDYKGKRYASCLEHCEYVAAVYAEQPEGREAVHLMSRIKADPEHLAVATQQANEKAANLQLVLAKAYLNRGRVTDAKTSLEQVVRLSPNGPSAEYARAELVKLRR